MQIYYDVSEGLFDFFSIEMKTVCKIFFRKPERRHHSENLVGKWKDNIKSELKEMVLADLDWTRLARNRDRYRDIVSTTGVFLVRQNAENF
jgi:hypothetical protein